MFAEGSCREAARDRDFGHLEDHIPGMLDRFRPDPAGARQAARISGSSLLCRADGGGGAVRGMPGVGLTGGIMIAVRGVLALRTVLCVVALDLEDSDHES